MKLLLSTMNKTVTGREIQRTTQEENQDQL